MSEFMSTDEHPMGVCPDTCLNLYDKPHLEAVVEWIGDMPLMHGEREDWVDGVDYCLCGHPVYGTCPERESGSVMSMVLGDPYGGKLDDPEPADE